MICKISAFFPIIPLISPMFPDWFSENMLIFFIFLINSPTTANSELQMLQTIDTVTLQMLIFFVPMSARVTFSLRR